MPIHMLFVGQQHALVLDTQTDKSHLVKRSTPNDYLFTFDANGAGYPPSGEIVCHIGQRNNMLYLENNLGIEAAPRLNPAPCMLFRNRSRLLEPMAGLAV